MAGGRLSPAAHKAFHAGLMRWYHAHGRHELPWRITRDPYAIYISEIMLQQTQVETVRTRFYDPFLKRFPTLKSLAEAELSEVLTLWQGLGYYRRAAHLHKAAQAAKGIMPENVEALMALPGVGRNTAHAVASFAYNHPVPVMEANVKRVLARIFALKQPTENQLWERADALMDRARPFDYNQAMMDLGSQICTPKSPDCPHCPANAICEGKKNPESYPAPKEKKKVPVRRRTILVEMDAQGRVKASPRQGAFLHGLYQFTETEAKAPEGATHLGNIIQTYSHFQLQAEIYLVSSRRPVRAPKAMPGSSALKNEELDSSSDLIRGLRGNDMYSLDELHCLPMSMAEKKILRLLAAHVTDAA